MVTAAYRTQGTRSQNESPMRNEKESSKASLDSDMYARLKEKFGSVE